MVTTTSRPRWASAIFLLALTAIHVVPLLPALGLEGCFCDETMCVHRHAHPGARGQDAAAHCDLAAATTAAAEPDCTMRGCSHERDQALLTLGAGAMPPSVAMAAPLGSSRLPAALTPSLLDRLPSIEAPPPDAFPV